MRNHRIGATAVATAAAGAMLLGVTAPAALADETDRPAARPAAGHPAADGAAGPERPRPALTEDELEELKDRLMERLEPLLARSAENRGISPEEAAEPVEERIGRELDRLASAQDPSGVVDTVTGLLDGLLKLLTSLLDSVLETLNLDSLIPQGPDLDIPELDIPELDIPEIGLPGTELPGTELPETELPDSELPGFEEPGFEEPDTDLPDTGLPDAEVPGAARPETLPATELPVPEAR